MGRTITTLRKPNRTDHGTGMTTTTTTALLQCCLPKPFRCLFMVILSIWGALLFYCYDSSVAVTTNLPRNNHNNHAAADSPMSSIQPVHCVSQLANRRNDSADPNKSLPTSPSKYVNQTDPPFHISLHDANFDRMRWNHIMNQGNYYETGITEQFHTILGGSSDDSTSKGLVLDVGMNIGWFTLYSRAMGHQVVGFDPNPIMHTRVCESLQLNQWSEDQSVHTFAYGLGSSTAMLNMTLGKNPGGSSFLQDRLAAKFRRTLAVPVVPLDHVAEQQGWLHSSSSSSSSNKQPQDPIRIKLWKLDVEGYEYQVLKGSFQLLHSGNVENILMENSNTNLREVVDMYATIYHAGYELHMISSVNGEPYHEELVTPLNQDLQDFIQKDMDLEKVGTHIPFLAKVTCNLWWKQTQKRGGEATRTTE